MKRTIDLRIDAKTRRVKAILSNGNGPISQQEFPLMEQAIAFVERKDLTSVSVLIDGEPYLDWSENDGAD